MRYQHTNERRAVILMVVLSLLTLFAIVGISFVLYADAEAAAARVFREAETAQRADVEPEQALAFFLSQLIYDANDVTGAGSALRGHSFARTMYGYNSATANLNAFNGIGRLHYTGVFGQDDYQLVNYTWFSGDGFIRFPERYNATPGNNPAAGPNYTFVGGNAPYTYPDLNNMFLAAIKADGTVLAPSFHRNYTNGFGTLAPTNPNWYIPSSTNPALKYMVLRPRPADHNGFPAPDDAGGDVKNLVWAPGGNDSIWLDLGAPVMTAPDGTLYKMLFAPLIIDLDGRVNLNVAGNILAYATAMTSPTSWQATAAAHVSNQGWGPWEINLSKVLYGDQASWQPSAPPANQSTPPEWMRLLTGMTNVVPTATAPTAFAGLWMYPGPPAPPPPGLNPLNPFIYPGVPGKYLQTPSPATAATPAWTPTTSGYIYQSGTFATAGPPTSTAAFGTLPHFYAQQDSNGLNETTPPYSSCPAPPGFLTNLPAGGNPPPSPTFPQYLQGYLNGGVSGTNPAGAELTNHPALYNWFRPPLYNTILTRVFGVSDMEPLLRPNMLTNTSPLDANTSALMSDLIRLCPSNFGPGATSTRYRNLVTTLSMDLGAPGVSPYWWNGMPATAYASNPNPQLAPIGTAVPFPTLPPNNAVAPAGPTNAPGTNPPTSEFDTNWQALSANTISYVPTQFIYTPPASPPPAQSYTSPGGRIRLNRPLPPYPHMGSGVTPPYTAQPPNATLSPYGVAYNLTNAAIANQYQAALNARQALANDIYRRLLAIAGVAPIPLSATNPPPVGTAGNPSSLQLIPRRWLAQLAVNIVDYMDEDDIITPFNFYTIQDANPYPAPTPPNPLVPPAPTAPNQPGTQGPDDNTAPPGNAATQPTGANPDYWVFGTELPKVVLTEAVAEANNPNPAMGFPANSDNVKVWVELFNTMQAPPVPANTQSQDAYRVPLYITIPNTTSGYSPYRITIAQTTMNQPPPVAPPVPQLPDASANVLGKAYAAAPFPVSTTDADFAAVVPMSTGSASPTQLPFPVPGSGNSINAGVDAPGDVANALPFFLIGPQPAAKPYSDPFSANLPPNVPVLRTPTPTSMNYTPNWTAASTTDERTTGLTVMLRRLANPYLPLQPNPSLPYYNPYVTVDYIQNVPIQSMTTLPPTNQYFSRGKTQPYAALTQVNVVGGVPQAQSGTTTLATSPVQNQLVNATAPPAGAVQTSPAGQNPAIYTTFGYANYPLPPSGHNDWLVHLDRPPVSPLELMHVSAWPPYMLSQQFMLGPNNLAVNPGSAGPPPVPPTLNTFGHYAPWLDALPTGQTLATVQCPWWFDSSLTFGTQSHRLYRLFDFLESDDWTFGVNGLGRIPGKVNINTIWDAEILQALLDGNPSMHNNGTTYTVNPSNNPTNAADPIAQIFANMLKSRSPNGAPGLTGVQNATDRPFLPLSIGLNAAGTQQFPTNATSFPTIGTSVTTDTLLRMNPTSNTLLLFQNPTDTTANAHPYWQTQFLTKLYNNVTTRSNTFAVFLTVGFFQVTNAATTPPTLGPEIGRSEGRQVRHRMFAIVDRTNLSVFATTSSTAVTGPSLTNTPPGPAGQATITLNTAPTATVQVGTQLVIEPGTANEETVVVQAITGSQITANFTKAHPNQNVTGIPSTIPYAVIQRGNPGPQLTPYDLRKDPLTVLYYSIID